MAKKDLKAASKFPKVHYVIFEDEITSLGKVKFRAFTTGEHKKLLEAIGIQDNAAVINTLVAIIDAATFNELPIEKTPMYILDELYLKIYIKSMGEFTDVVFTCNGTNEEGEKCNESFTVKVPLDSAKMEIPENFVENKIVKISETGGIKLRQATAEQYKKLKSDSSYEITDEFIFASIECMFDGDNITVPGIDFTMDELADYLETLPDSVMSEITEFFDATPILTIDVNLKCPKCGNEHKFTLKGLDDFFA